MIAHPKGREKALERFGWTERRAEWIVLASLHGGVFTRAQKTDGSVACWGDDGDGQASPPEGEFTSVSAGGETIHAE